MIEIIIFLVIVFGIYFVLTYQKTKKHENEQQLKENYIKPEFKTLSKEQIENIHSRGMITPSEKVKEWEGMGLCAPGDAIGSAAERCKKFRYCCHDCLVDYANNYEEYSSIFQNIKIVYPKIHNNN